MKKIYQAPTMKTVKIMAVKMFATSVNMYGKNAGGAGFSRDNNWDDWDDDDF